MTGKQQRRKFNRKIRKRIEAVLHPLPKFGGFEILHEHRRNGTAPFSAYRWREDHPFIMPGEERRYIEFPTEAFIDNPDFYENIKADLLWLAGM